MGGREERGREGGGVCKGDGTAQVCVVPSVCIHGLPTAPTAPTAPTNCSHLLSPLRGKSMLSKFGFWRIMLDEVWGSARGRGKRRGQVGEARGLDEAHRCHARQVPPMPQ